MEMFTPSFRPSVLNGQALLFNIPKLSQSGKEVTAERARPSRDVVAPKGSRSAGQPGSVRPPPTRPEHEGGDSQGPFALCPGARAAPWVDSARPSWLGDVSQLTGQHKAGRPAPDGRWGRYLRAPGN